jgi:hypothetical protein
MSFLIARVSVLLGMAVGACRQPERAPESGQPAPLAAAEPRFPAAVRRPGLTITLMASPTTAAPGDTVRLTAVAHNATAEPIVVGVQCGPSMDVQVTSAAGEATSVLRAMTAEPKGFFTCEFDPRYHLVRPRDSLTTRLWWRAPSARGEYVAVAGARGEADLRDLSAPVRIVVR